MGKVMRYQGGSVAIYSDATPATPSTAPLTDPLNNLGVLEFHSDLFYPKIVDTYTGSGSIPGLTSYQRRTNKALVKIAHGLGASPLALGTITATYNSGKTYTYSLNGTVVVPNEDWHFTLGGQSPTGVPGPTPNSWEYKASSPAFLTLTSDSTNVYLDCTQSAVRSPGGFYFNGVQNIFPTTSAAQSFTYIIHVLDLLDTQTVAPTGDVTKPQMELSPTRITMGRRKFDTNDKHIRSSVTGADVMISGESIITIGAPASATASTPNGSHEGTMGILARNLTTYAQADTGQSAQSAGAYPTPTETQMQFP